MTDPATRFIEPFGCDNLTGGHLYLGKWDGVLHPWQDYSVDAIEAAEAAEAARPDTYSTGEGWR